MANDRIDIVESPGGLQHFKTAVLEDGTLLAGFDYHGKAVNVLNVDSMAEWRQLVQWVEGSSAVTGVVLLSLKHGNFCAGADLEEMHDAQRRKSFQALDQLVVDAHTVFNVMGRSRKPFVAAVEGACLGGGLELALACHARVASTHERTVLALPEVRLGILPGFGGTQRLPRLVGLVSALDVITTGKTVFPRQALRIGLIDAMVTSIPSHVRRLEEIQQESLIQAALAQVRKLRGAMDRRRSLPLSRWLPGAPLIRSLVCRVARRRVVKRVRNFYPAPLRAIDAVEQGLGMDLLDASMTVEKPLLIELMASSVSTHLVGLFLTGEAVKRKAAMAAQGATRLGVLGAGLMGSQIAGQLADRGYDVVMRDLAPDILASAMGRVHKALAGQVRKKIIAPSEFRYRSLRITPTTKMSDVSSVGLVIEAVSEKLEVKRAVLAEFELEAPSGTIFATNTSSYTLADIAVNAICPDRCVGLHFFNPVAKMQLVEVVRAPFTSERALAQACTVAKRLGKFPLLVRDGPGFLVNRILSRYLAEAVILVGEGVSIQRIDRVAQDFGMAIDSGHPMGPLELIDLIGLPVAIHVLASLTVLGHRIESREALLRKLLGDGGGPLPFWKSGKENPEAVEVIMEHRRAFGAEALSLSEEVLHRRLFLPMVDEAVRCLQDQIVEQPREIDLALTYGIGFPGFRGGLLTWARDTMTPRVLAGELESLAQRYGKRFEPCAGLAAGGW